MNSLRSKCKSLINSKNCFGCCNREKSSVVVEVDKPSNGLKIQGKVVKKYGDSSDGLCSTSTCEMDQNIKIRSQSSNLHFNPRCSINNSTEFVNHGLILWYQMRQQWRERKDKQEYRVQEPSISQNSTYDSLLSTNKLFPRPIPLKDMVHFLVDVWEEEGLYK